MFKRLIDKLPFMKNRRREDRLALVAFVALAAVVIFGSFFLTRLPGRISFGESGDVLPDITKLLPDMAITSVDSVVTLPDEPQPAYAVGYAIGRGSAVALFTWDKGSSRYVHADDVALANVQEGQLAAAPTLTLVNFGAGASPTVLARLAFGPDASAVFGLLRVGEKLTNLPMRDGLDVVKPSFFIDGSLRAPDESVASSNSQLEIKDVDGDDWSDVVITEQESGGGVSGGSLSVSAYRWNGDELAFDKELSRTLTEQVELE